MIVISDAERDIFCEFNHENLTQTILSNHLIPLCCALGIIVKFKSLRLIDELTV